MTAALFLACVALAAASVAALAARFLPRGPRLGVLVGLPLWLVWVGLVAGSGGVRPLGLAPVVAPAALFVALGLVRGRLGARIALAVPPALLMGAQVYRVGVEMVLHRLWQEGLAPRALTYEGANPDILVGLSAPLAAWLAARGWRRTALAWNVLGLLALANVVARSVLTAPGPLNLIPAEVPNLVPSTPPYALLPGFLAPLAVALHALAIRSLRARMRDATPAPAATPASARAAAARPRPDRPGGPPGPRAAMEKSA